MKTNFKLVTINQTKLWDESITAHAGRIYGVYLFDALRQVNCCEITPSYEMYPVSDHALVDIDRDSDKGSLDEYLMGCGESGDCVYHHCRSIDALPSDHFHDFGVEDHDEETSWEEALESKLEYVKANQRLTLPKGLGCRYWDTKDAEEVLLHYLTAALWSSHHNDEPMDRKFSVKDVPLALRESAMEDVKLMIVQAELEFLTTPSARNIWNNEQLGHDFWLTRNGHGTGFWDRCSSGSPEAAFGETMSAYSRAAGGVDLYVGDDGLIYAM